MVRMFVWNDVDMPFILNFDRDRKLVISQCHESRILSQHAIDGCHFKLSISMF